MSRKFYRTPNEGAGHIEVLLLAPAFWKLPMWRLKEMSSLESCLSIIFRSGPLDHQCFLKLDQARDTKLRLYSHWLHA